MKHKTHNPDDLAVFEEVMKLIASTPSDELAARLAWRPDSSQDSNTTKPINTANIDKIDTLKAKDKLKPRRTSPAGRSTKRVVKATV